MEQKLLQLFEQEKRDSPAGRGIVFWYDEEAEGRELEEIRDTLQRQGIQVWELTEQNSFRTKLLLEVEQPEASFLLYAPFPKPEPEANYLLDILLYSAEFKTDETELLAGELGLDAAVARPFLERYKLFFRAKGRREQFKRLLPLQGDERDWKTAVFAVLAGVNSTHPQDIFRAILEEGLDEEKNEALVRIKKFAYRTDFYAWIYAYFGIPEQGTSSLQEVFATLVYCHVTTALPELEGHLSIYETRTPNACYVFLEDWLGDPRGREVLTPLLRQLEGEWGIFGLLQELPAETIANCTTFPVVDVWLLDYLREMLLHHEVSGLPLEELIQRRLAGVWAQEKHFRLAYHFYRYALYLTLEKETATNPHYRNKGADWAQAYVDRDWRIDQVYRKLMWVYSEAGMPEELTPLRDKLTAWYEDEFIAALARYTDEVVGEELATHWPIKGLMQQHRFFSTTIAPLVENTSERIFVIISDALRYEAGAELAERLMKRLNADVTLKPMQGVLPSYTRLGMAALLPGKITGIDEQGTVYVNGMPVRGIREREKVLQQEVPASRAFWVEEFIQLGKEKGLQAIRGQRVIYIYHNRIDATGDQQVTETYTFQDVRQAIDELERVVGRLAGTFGAKRIFITADHGFLYQHTPVTAEQLAERVGGGVVDQNRRFALGHNLKVPVGGQSLSLAYLGLDLEAVIAKGQIRFRSGGGMKFVHGGAMPQEVILPLIQYREIHGQARRKEEQRTDVRVAMRSRVITNYQFNVIFFQEQKASAEIRPRHLRAAFYKGEERISNEVILVFDSEEEAPDRHTEVAFSLIEDRYPVGDSCTLRLEDVTGSKTELYGEEPFELRVYDI